MVKALGGHRWSIAGVPPRPTLLPSNSTAESTLATAVPRPSGDGDRRASTTAASGTSGPSRGGGRHSLSSVPASKAGDPTTIGVCVCSCVFVFVYVYVCMCLCVCVCVYVCMSTGGCCTVLLWTFLHHALISYSSPPPPSACTTSVRLPGLGVALFCYVCTPCAVVAWSRARGVLVMSWPSLHCLIVFWCIFVVLQRRCSTIGWALKTRLSQASVAARARSTSPPRQQPQPWRMPLGPTVLHSCLDRSGDAKCVRRLGQ